LTRAEGKRPGPDRGASLEGEPPPTPPPAARAWRRSTPPARYAPAAGTAKATCAAIVRPRAGRHTPTSPTFTPSRAAPWRGPCGGSSRRRNSRDQHRAQAAPSWARWAQKSGRGSGRARCSRPTAERERRCLRLCAGGVGVSLEMPRCVHHTLIGPNIPV